MPQPLNGRRLPARGPEESFRVLVAGHLYGDMTAEASPARTFTAARERLVSSGPDLVLACGDTFRMFATPWIESTNAAIEDLPMPVFNAIGNHDATPDRAAYVAAHGPTWGAFVHGGCLFVQLDTELEPWEIAGDQLQFLRDVLRLGRTRDDIRAVCCYGHKAVFAFRQRYFALAMGCNAHDGLRAVPRFQADVMPMLRELAAHKPVCWLAGDVGAAHTLPCFHDVDPSSGVRFVAVGLGDSPRDLVVELEVAGDDLAVRTIGLGSSPAPSIGEFGPDAWERHVFPAGRTADQAAACAALPQ